MFFCFRLSRPLFANFLSFNLRRKFGLNDTNLYQAAKTLRSSVFLSLKSKNFLSSFVFFLDLVRFEVNWTIPAIKNEIKIKKKLVYVNIYSRIKLFLILLWFYFLDWIHYYSMDVNLPDNTIDSKCKIKCYFIQVCSSY